MAEIAVSTEISRTASVNSTKAISRIVEMFGDAGNAKADALIVETRRSKVVKSSIPRIFRNENSVWQSKAGNIQPITSENTN